MKKVLNWFWQLIKGFFVLMSCLYFGLFSSFLIFILLSLLVGDLSFVYWIKDLTPRDEMMLWLGIYTAVIASFLLQYLSHQWIQSEYFLDF